MFKKKNHKQCWKLQCRPLWLTAGENVCVVCVTPPHPEGKPYRTICPALRSAHIAYRSYMSLISLGKLTPDGREFQLLLLFLQHIQHGTGADGRRSQTNILHIRVYLGFLRAVLQSRVRYTDWYVSIFMKRVLSQLFFYPWGAKNKWRF